MSEVTEGELVMWSVDPGPMAGVLERQLWRMATAARSYLNRMRAAELAHGVAAGERDAVTVERDELLRLKARSAQDEVFRIQHEIAIAGDLVTIRVAPLRDPAIRALPLGVRLGLVVCDE